MTDNGTGARRPPVRRGQSERLGPATGILSISARAFSFSFRDSIELQLRDVGSPFLGRQVGLRDLFSLGHVAPQADHQRQIGAHARIAARTAMGAAQRLLRLRQIF